MNINEYLAYLCYLKVFTLLFIDLSVTVKYGSEKSVIEDL